MSSSSQQEALATGVAPRAEAADRGYWREIGARLARDPIAMLGLALVLALAVCAVFAPIIAPFDPVTQHRDGLTADGRALSPGENGFLLGSDALGRDELSRLLYGARVSLVVGVGGNLLAAFLGVLIGGTAGLLGRWPQALLMRIADVILSFPVLLLAIALLAVTQPSVTTIVLIIGFTFGAYLARIVFGQVVSLRQREFVVAARTCGVRTPSILWRHIVPHVMPSVIVYATLGVAAAIMLEAALSYVGVGIQPPDASWGNMISEGQSYLITAPWLIAAPGVAIVLAMIGFSLLGDGLRDALDPTLEQRRLSAQAVR